jgi:hypothetical protein
MDATPKRRWFRFSLRTLLVVVAVIGVVLGLVAQKQEKHRRQRAAVAALNRPTGRNLGAAYDFQWDPEAGCGQYGFRRGTPPGPSWLRERVAVDWFSDVVWARARSDEQLDHIQAFSKLRWLHLENAKVSPAGMKVLEGLGHLEEVTMCGSNVTDEGLWHLNQLTKLRSLQLGATAITDDGMRHLSQLKELEFLDFCVTKIEGSGLRHLRGLPRLKTLWLASTKLTDESLMQLEPLVQLEQLILRDTQVSDIGLVHLKGLVNLRILDVSRTAVTPAGRNELKRALPLLDHEKRDANLTSP